MYKTPHYAINGVTINNSTEGETLETKIERLVTNKEPIKDGAPLIYTERSEGIRASTNIRTDRFEVAVDATTKVAKSFKAKRDERAKPKPKTDEKDGKPEPTQGKPETGTSEAKNS